MCSLDHKRKNPLTMNQHPIGASMFIPSIPLLNKLPANVPRKSSGRWM